VPYDISSATIISREWQHYLFSTTLSLSFWFLFYKVATFRNIPFLGVAIIAVSIVITSIFLPIFIKTFKVLRSGHVIIKLRFKIYILACVVLEFGFLITIMLAGGYILPKLTSILINNVLQMLEGNERVQSILVAGGIIFFVIGNLLQLLATIG
jgi:hypothetical protein